MSIRHLSRLALAGVACAAAAGAASALEVRAPHAPVSVVSHAPGMTPISTIRTVGAPVATRAKAHVHYIVPVVPTLLGIRPAPVGQPVVYVIDQPEPRAERRGARGGETAERRESGPRILTIRP
jgi:hypothetical protein